MNIKKIILSFVILFLVSISYVFAEIAIKGWELSKGEKYITAKVVFDKAYYEIMSNNGGRTITEVTFDKGQ
jgi:hypothetical protein